ncbi:Hcp family type VI secretion system effector [Phycicoccus sonneratiae]|uniref:Type VI secretion system tube protein Hcp n=1 Tax=Phycicoccus sonneratiae TaxID=2807628 RepID=A0ABS2CL46_9MICO|nr:type VI secretion system tube protein Hcp [Phycicoccus sonneraticus]MBM6400602.1 type VI secretion system tube protein Hcp [Phycicoccus sonneraticus]
MAIFARIGTIKGESQDARHRDEIDVLAWSWGVSQTAAAGHGGGAGSGKATFQDFVLTHHIDRASPLLLKACATGQHVKDATVTVRRPGGGQQEYLVITLGDVLVSGVSMGVSEDGSTHETVILSFARVDLEYRPQKPNGSLGTGVRFTHDLRTGKTG